MKKRIHPDEARRLAEEQWQEIMNGLAEEARTLYEQASELYNLKHIARIAGTKPAVDELMSVLGVLGEATQQAKQKAVLAAASCGFSDTHIARRIGVHRHTVKRWREEYESWQNEQTMTTAEVDALTQNMRLAPNEKSSRQ